MRWVKEARPAYVCLLLYDTLVKAERWGQKTDQWLPRLGGGGKDWGLVMELCYILIIIVITRLYAFVKTWNDTSERVHHTAYKILSEFFKRTFRERLVKFEYELYFPCYISCIWSPHCGFEREYLWISIYRQNVMQFTFKEIRKKKKPSMSIKTKPQSKGGQRE